MSLYVDLLIQENDLVLDPARAPRLVDDRASIAQDIAHMIRESGLLVTLVAERDRLRQRDCIQQLELQPGHYLVTGRTTAFGEIEVTL